MNTARNAEPTAAMNPQSSKLPLSPNMPLNRRQAVHAKNADNAKYSAMNAARPSIASHACRLYAAVAAVRFGGTVAGPGG